MLSIREVNCTKADQLSAVAFFDSLTAMYDFKESVALDMFARTGDLTVVNYQDHVKELHLWELMPEHRGALVSRNPTSLQIGCSYETAEKCFTKYDLIVVDSPQGVHSDAEGRVHFEHFDVVRDILPRLCSESCVIVLYVNKSPYNKDIVGSHGYDKYSEYDYSSWMQARELFYGASQITEEVAIQAYRVAIGSWAKVEQVLMVPCFSDVSTLEPYAFRLALKIKRK